MTDHELLELAAKAADLVFELKATPLVLAVPADAERPWRYWNPLDDDGDAFRLSVKLNLFDENGKFTYGLAVAMNEFSDPYEATRRAIVLAAAEIGKNMPA